VFTQETVLIALAPAVIDQSGRESRFAYTPPVFDTIMIDQMMLDQRTVDASSINVFKSRLIYIRDNRMGFFMD